MAWERARVGKLDRASCGVFDGNYCDTYRCPWLAPPCGVTAAVARIADGSSRRWAGPGRAHQWYREGFADEGFGTVEVGEEKSSPPLKAQYQVVPLPAGKICYKRRP